MTRPVRALLSTLAFLSAFAAFDCRAWAFRCTPVGDKALSQAWNQRCIPYYISNSGELLDSEAARTLIAESFEVWTEDECTDLEFIEIGTTSQTGVFDTSRLKEQQNVIASIEDPKQLDLFPSSNLLAITLTSFSTETGEIFDADILLNAVDFRFADLNAGTRCAPVEERYDLRNTLVHEIGHFLGFDHESFPDSTMFASAQACEIKKRDLSSDDISGVCKVYPAGRPTMTCEPPLNYDVGRVPSALRAQCERAQDAGGGCNCVPPEHARRERGTLIGIGVGALFAGVLALRRRRR